jgi:cytochrome c-type protein NapC
MTGESEGRLRRLWGALRRPSVKYSLLTLLGLGFVAGIVFWGGFHTALEATNSLAFCTGCHEMRDTVYVEYQDTIHFKNRTGVRAICSDCHVPHEWGPKMIRKAKASLEVWGKLMGHIDTPEKFEAKRMELATHEWARMSASGSQECRNCHNFEAMSGEKQKQSVYKKHMGAQAAGKTCIDCHKGIAHHLPKEYRDPNEEEGMADPVPAAKPAG